MVKIENLSITSDENSKPAQQSRENFLGNFLKAKRAEKDLTIREVSKLLKFKI